MLRSPLARSRWISTVQGHAPVAHCTLPLDINSTRTCSVRPLHAIAGYQQYKDMLHSPLARSRRISTVQGHAPFAPCTLSLDINSTRTCSGRPLHAPAGYQQYKDMLRSPLARYRRISTVQGHAPFAPCTLSQDINSTRTCSVRPLHALAGYQQYKDMLHSPLARSRWISTVQGHAPFAPCTLSQDINSTRTCSIRSLHAIAGYQQYKDMLRSPLARYRRISTVQGHAPFAPCTLSLDINSTRTCSVRPLHAIAGYQQYKDMLRSPLARSRWISTCVALDNRKSILRE